MRAERLGSYSIEATLAGMPNLSRLKSITRYACLWPPEINRDVTCPVLLRPPVFLTGSTRDFSGVSFVMSSRDTAVMKRRLAVVGENFLIAIFASFRFSALHLGELGDLLAFREFHVCFFPVRTIA